MSHTDTEPHDVATDPTPESRPGLPVWKKIAFAAALILGLVGVGMGAAGGAGKETAPQPAGAGSTASGLAPNSFNGLPGQDGKSLEDIFGIGDGGGTEVSNGAPAEEQSPWAPFFMKGGLSFAAAFAVGYAMRTFLKMAALVGGVVVLAILALQHFEVVQIDWTQAEGYWDSLTAGIGDQFSSFKQFLTGSLPSAGMGSFGLVTGFRR